MFVKYLTAFALTSVSSYAIAAPITAGVPQRAATDPAGIVSPANPQAKPVPLGDLLALRDLEGAAWTPEGKDVIISTNITGRYNLWRVPLEGGFPQQLIQSDEAQSGIVVKKDGKSVLFESDKGGNDSTDIFMAPLHGGEVVNLTHSDDVAEGGAVFSPDGTTLAISHRPKDDASANIAILDIATGKVRVLTQEKDPEQFWRVVDFAEQGRSIIAARANAGQTQSAIWKIDVATGKAIPLTQNKPGVINEPMSVAPDGNHILVTTETKEGTRQAAILTIADAKLRVIKPSAWDQSGGSFAPDGKSLTYTTNVDGQLEISLYTLADGVSRSVDLPKGVNAEIGGFSPDGKQLLVLHSSSNSPPDIWSYSLETSTLKQVTRLGLASVEPANLPKSQIVHYASPDGTIISAVLLMPFNLPRDGSAPAIVMPHGGPNEQTFDSFDSEAVAFASRGYVVIAPNFRGSTGYGRTFKDSNRNDLGGGDLVDVVEATKFLTKTGYVDSKRIGIAGQSYGGFMTLMAVGKTPDVFAAGASDAGIVNWYSMYKNQDPSIQQYQISLIGHPDNNQKVYDAVSPITYLRQTKAPLLVIQGDNDPIVPKPEAEQVVSILKSQGNVVEALYYPDEGHGLEKIEHQRDSLEKTIAWFEQYLKGKK